MTLNVEYHVFGATFTITPAKMVVALLLGGFLYLEFSHDRIVGDSSTYLFRSEESSADFLEDCQDINAPFVVPA